MHDQHHTIQACLKELDCTSYHEICSAYFIAQLIIAYSQDGNYADTILYSRDLQRRLHVYRNVVLTAPISEHIDTWVQFCSSLQTSKFSNDFVSFIGEFMPYAVLDWKRLSTFFKKTGSLLVALILILQNPPISSSRTPQDALQNLFDANASTYRLCGLDLATFRKCWNAVYTYPLLSSEIHRNAPIVKAVEIYRHLYLPMSDLLCDYAALVLSQEESMHKQAARGNRRKQIDKPAVENTRSKVDQQLAKALHALQREKPTDIIRGLFYSGRNDAGFECTFLLQAYLDSTSPTTRNLIINPSPDYLVYFAKQNRKATCYIPDQTIAELYAREFNNYEYISVNTVPCEVPAYDRVLILARDLPFDNYAFLLESVAKNAQIIALIPEEALRSLQHAIKKLAFPLHINRVIHLPSVMMQSLPKRKVLVFISSNTQASSFRLLFSVCDEEKTQFTIKKHYYDVPYSWFDTTMSLVDIRDEIIRQKKSVSRLVSEPKVYSFSPEIKLYYTLQMDCKNRIAARMCYRAILRKNQTHRKRGDVKTKIIEKGLRHQTIEEVLKATELTALYDSIAPAIVEDILDYYKEDLSSLSLKTVWLCLRSELSTRASYKEDVAIELFCTENQSLATLCIGTSNHEDYETAMQSLFPKGDNIRQKHWDIVYMILSAAVKNKYIPYHPLAEAMPAITARISDRQKRSRNTLVKRTLGLDEEKRMVNYLLEPVDKLIDGREIRRIDTGGGWIAALLHMFTPLSLREICALRWEDFQQIFGLPTYQFIVHTYLTDTGKVKNTIDQALEKYRSVPVAPTLASLLLAYKAFIAARYNLTDDLIALWPIVLDSFSVGKSHHIPQMCSVKTAATRCKDLISVANIKSNEIVLPDAIYGNYVTDLNAYQGDLLHTNLKFHLRHVCKLSVAETCYLLGQKAPTTLAQHYVEHNTPIHQHRMALKQERWVARHIHANPTPTRVISDSIIDQAWEHTFRSHSVEVPSITVSIVPNKGLALPAMDIEINSQHGMDGNIIVYSEEQK